MEPNKPKSIFDPPTSRNGFQTSSTVRSNTTGPQQPFDTNSFIKKKEGCFDIPPERRPCFGGFSDPKLFDEYDKMDHFQTIGNVSHLMQMIPVEDIISESYDDVEITMKALTEDGGVRKLVLQHGNGTKVPMDSTVWVKYIAYAEGNDHSIDDYSSREKMSFFNIGKPGLLPGLLIAFQSMEVGEISKFLISSKYAYGKLGCPNLVAPNCRLLYVIEMIKFTVEPEEKPVWKKSSKERIKLDFEVVFKAADDLREAGNQKIKFKLYKPALERYEMGLKILKDAWILEKKEQVQMHNLKYTLNSNLALCHLQLDEPELAVIACKAALRPDMPTPHSKLFYRYAKALLKLGKAEEAGKFCEKAEELNSRDFNIQVLQREIRAALAKEDKVKIELWKKMYQAPRSTQNTCTKE